MRETLKRANVVPESSREIEEMQAISDEIRAEVADARLGLQEMQQQRDDLLQGIEESRAELERLQEELKTEPEQSLRNFLEKAIQDTENYLPRDAHYLATTEELIAHFTLIIERFAVLESRLDSKKRDKIN